MDEMAKETAELGSYLMKYVVALGWIDRTPGDRAQKNAGGGTPMFVTTFIIEAKGMWFLITAGHILQAIETARENGQQLANFQLHDGLSSDSAHLQPIPFPIDGQTKMAYWHEEIGSGAGADYGIIPLSSLISDALKANGKMAIRQPWMQELPSTFDSYCMLGIPSEFQEEGTFATAVEVGISGAMISVRKIDTPPEHMRSAIPRFYGKIATDLRDKEGLPLKDIDGMSGGPIFGFVKSEKGMELWVVAIQSSWDAKTGTIAGCYFKQFAEEIASKITANNRAT